MCGLDVLIDLDDTLAYDHKVGEAEFYNIRYLNYSLFLEFLEVLQQLGVRIAFNSQGSEQRNAALVKAIVAKYFKDKPFHHQLFSGDHESVKRKKLQGLYDGIDLTRAIMIDDLSHLFAVKGEERNFLQVIPNLCRGADTDMDVKRHYQVVCANRLVRALGMIVWAFHLSLITKWTPVEALSAMQWYGNDGYRHSQTHAQSIYELGLSAMRRVSPDIQIKMDEGIVPWTFPFQLQARKNNMFEPEQLEAIVQNLPHLTKDEEDLLIPPRGFDAGYLFAL